MSFIQQYPAKYLAENNADSHKINVVFEMEGAGSYFSLSPTLRTPRWGDPGLYWGKPGLLWGVGIPDERSLDYLMPDSNFKISQRVEPEQGRGSTSIMTFNILDKNGEVTRFFSPGQEVNEPVGNKLIKVRIGYQNTNYPEDYFTVFRGYISSLKPLPTKTIVQLSDPNIKRRQQIFYRAQTKTTNSVNAVTTTIPVISSVDFHQQILGPAGTYDSGVKTYIQVDDEVMEFGPSGIAPTQFTVTRGARGTTAASHDSDSDVDSTFEIQDNMITMALKLMLSGWNGPWKTGQAIEAIQDVSGGPLTPNALLLPTNVDGIDDLGLTTGDYCYVTGSTAGNDGTYIVQSVISTNSRVNNVVKFTTNFPNPETNNSNLVMSIRSKYDVYPTTFGCKLTPAEVDVATYELLRDTYLISQSYRMRFYNYDPGSGKEFIEKEIMLPVGAYSITRLGKLSMNMTTPPLPTSDLAILSRDNIKNPEQISVERATNNRRYFNEIQYSFDKSDDGKFGSVRTIIDAQSLSEIDITSVLPIPASGFHTDLNSESVVDTRGNFLIQRYTNIAIYIECTTNWKTGSVIETGNVVLLRDDGTLKIANYATGERNMGDQLWEVIMCDKDPKNGEVKLGLLSGTGFYYGFKYGTISPSSAVVGAESSTTQIKIQDSYGSVYPGNEPLKWERTIGLPIRVHDYTYSQDYETTLLGFDLNDPYKMNVSPALPVAPGDGWTVDITPYPSDVSKTVQRLYKLLYTHFDPSVAVVSGISETEVQVASGDIGKFRVGNTLLARNTNYSSISPEVVISAVDTGTNVITVGSPFGFVPDTTYSLEGIGFLDGGEFYRYV